VITEIKNNRVEKVEFKALTGNSKLLDDLFNYFKLTIERKEGICGKSEFVSNKKYMAIHQKKSQSGYSTLNEKTYHEEASGIEMESNRIVFINK
jgi:oligoribonuclease NrnB/cAMP/cGMP phosphodiesterase (DHH superfamily)